MEIFKVLFSEFYRRTILIALFLVTQYLKKELRTQKFDKEIQISTKKGFVSKVKQNVKKILQNISIFTKFIAKISFVVYSNTSSSPS
jgi:hypothetical protein